MSVVLHSYTEDWQWIPMVLKGCPSLSQGCSSLQVLEKRDCAVDIDFSH